jgi:hypothetical protein
MNRLKKMFPLKLSFKGIIEALGSFFTVIIFICFIFIIGRKLLEESRTCWLIFLACPFMAYSCRNGLTIAIYCIFFLNLFCTVAMFASNDKHITYAESILISGHQSHHKELIEEDTDDEGNYYPEHYETEYTFISDPNQSKAYVSFMQNFISLFPLFNLGIVYFILRKRLFK